MTVGVCKHCGVELPPRRPGQRGRPPAQCRSCAKATGVKSKKQYPHGSHARYVLNGCRCEECSTANRVYERERAARVAPAYVAAGPAREHVQMLAEHGVGLKRVAEVSGVSHGALWKLMYGLPGRGPSKRVRPETLERILRVSPADAADGAKVPAAPTWHLIDEMVAAGVPRARIAERIGHGQTLQLGRNMIAARNARAVRELHRRWCAGEVELVRRDSYGGQRVASPPRRDGPAADVSDLLLELAEIVEERHDQASWRASAACRGRPVWVWFPARGDRATLDKALQVCGACMVRDECRSANLHKRDGVYGGLTAVRRRSLRAEESSVEVAAAVMVQHDVAEVAG